MKKNENTKNICKRIGEDEYAITGGGYTVYVRDFGDGYHDVKPEEIGTAGVIEVEVEE